MKRSEINNIIKNAEAFIKKFNFSLPPFVNWTFEDWKNKGHEFDEIRDNMLGWDITDYGLGKFNDVGLILVTIRNGNRNDKKYEKPYAEKLLISQENQICPMHFHWSKMEDIINRGGGVLAIQLYNSTKNKDFSDSDVTVFSDGYRYTVPAGSIVRLSPGESITIHRGTYHKFWAEKGHGPVLIGEVSQCNDDNIDNCFYDKIGRFPKIEEDEVPYRLLCNEYPPANS